MIARMCMGVCGGRSPGIPVACPDALSAFMPSVLSRIHSADHQVFSVGASLCAVAAAPGGLSPRDLAYVVGLGVHVVYRAWK